jgi:hypothetical protein
MTVSPIITRGMGTNQALVTQGFRPAVVVVVAEKIEKRRRRGEDDADDDSDYDEYKISAFLVEVNGKEFENPIISKVEKIFETHVKTKVDADPTEVKHKKNKDFRVWVSGLKIRR